MGWSVLATRKAPLLWRHFPFGAVCATMQTLDSKEVRTMKRPSLGRAAIFGAAAAVAGAATVMVRRNSNQEISLAQIVRKIPIWGRSELRPPPENRSEGPYMGTGPTQ